MAASETFVLPAMVTRLRKAYVACEDALMAATGRVPETDPQARKRRTWPMSISNLMTAMRDAQRKRLEDILPRFASLTGVNGNLSMSTTSNQSANGARCARLALAIVSDNPSLVREDERNILLAACATLECDPPLPPTTPVPELPTPKPGAHALVEVAYAWRRRTKREVHGLPLAARATLQMSVIGMSEDDAPVVARLPFPDGGFLPVRRAHGADGPRWYRPLLAPNSRKPIRFSAFAAAMKSGQAWRDSPHLNARHRHDFSPIRDVRTLPHLDDYAAGPSTPTTEENAVDFDSATGLALRSCHDLVAFGDEVWQEIREPSAAVAAVRSGDPRMRLARPNSQPAWMPATPAAMWTAGTLASLEVQDTILHTRDIVGLAHVFLECDRHDYPTCILPFVALPISRLDVARRIASAMGGDQSGAVDEVEILDPSAFRKSTFDFLPAFLSLLEPLAPDFHDALAPIANILAQHAQAGEIESFDRLHPDFQDACKSAIVLGCDAFIDKTQRESAASGLSTIVECLCDAMRADALEAHAAPDAEADLDRAFAL